MSKSQSRIPSPARSQGAITPRRARTRRTLSSASPAQSEARLSTVVERFVKTDKFVLSPMNRRSVLPDDTDIVAPRRASWWKRLEGSSRDVLEALDTNKMTDDLMLEEYEFEVNKNDKQSQSVQQSQSSDNESVASIVVPQRRLFNQKKQTQAKFGDLMGSRKSLGKTNIEDQSIEDAPKNLFNKGPRNKPVFPAALLNSTNKTINKTVEPQTNKQTRPNLFGQAGGKRKNMFTDFVLSDSEEDSEVQHKVFGFKKNSKRISLGTRNRRMPSLTPSMTTEIDIDEWNILPSSTLIGAQETSSMSDDMEQVQDENQDDTLTENNASLNHTKQTRTSVIQSDEKDKTLTNENIEDGYQSRDMKMETNESKKVNKTHNSSKTELNVSGKDKTSLNKSAKRHSILTNTEHVEIEAVVVMQQQTNANDNGRLTENEQSLEDKMAELHGESVDKGECRQKFTSYKTQEHICEETNTTNHPNDSVSQQVIEQSAKAQEIRNYSKTANNTKETDNLCEKDKTKELERSAKGMITRDDSKEIVNQGEHMEIITEQVKNEEEIETNVTANETNQENVGEYENEEVEASTEEQGQDQAEKASKSDQDEDMHKSVEEVEPTVEEQESHHSEESSKSNQDENMEEIEEKQEESEMESEEEQVQSEEEQELTEEEQEQTEKEEQTEEEQEQTEEEQEQSEAEQEPSLEEQKSQNQSDELNQDVDEEDKSDGEIDQENQDEEMEKMVWNDNDDDKTSDASEKEMDAAAVQNNEIESNLKNTETSKSHSNVKQNLDKSKSVTNKSRKIVDASLDDDRMEEENDVVEETPNNSTQDTTGQNRNIEVSKVKSPEAVLQQNMTKDNESFRPIGRSTTFRKSKSVYETMHTRHSLTQVQESTLGSEGSRNTSTQGSEWDSHRTTRKTIRQTFGKEYTTRKSLRALVMEQSAKRQTELYNKNTSKFDKTTNKTVTEHRNEKNPSQINKTKNKTVIEDGNNKIASIINKTRNKTMIEDANSDNASKIDKTENTTVLEDINDQHIRFRRTSNRSTSNLSPNLKSPVHGTSTHHVPDPLISEHRASYHKSLHDTKEPEISYNLTNLEDSVNIPIPENDSGPEISMNVSYGHGMTASSYEDLKNSDVEMLDKENTSPKKEISRRGTSVRSKSLNNSDQEVLDYEASEQVISALVGQENSDHDESMENEKSESGNEEEIEHSEYEVEEISDHDESKQDEKSESEDEIEHSDNEVESEREEDSQQEIEPDSEHEETQEDIEEEEVQEIEEQEQSQEEIESDLESQEIEQEPESQEETSENESDQCEVSREPENENSDEEDFISALNSKYKTPERRGVSRIVFDSNRMSAEEIDFEGVSRQTDNDFTENTEREYENDISENERELSRVSMERVSEPIHDVSIASKKAMLLSRMEKIAKQNMERRQKFRDQIQKSLKPTSNYNFQDIGLKLPEYSIRRPQEPRKPKSKPKPTGIHTEELPKAFVEDLNYKPPKRFQPASAPWITKRLYKFLEAKLEPKYDYRARVRAEELVQSIFSFSKLVRRRDVAPPQAVEELKREMARLRIVNTHYEFYDFFHEFMPTEIRIKVNPDFVNKVPKPRNVFSEILQPRAMVE